MILEFLSLLKKTIFPCGWVKFDRTTDSHPRATLYYKPWFAVKAEKMQFGRNHLGHWVALPGGWLGREANKFIEHYYQQALINARMVQAKNNLEEALKLLEKEHGRE